MSASSRRQGRATAEVDSLGVYLREISQIPLLTGAEEQAVARRVREGDQGAFQTLVEANLRFVVTLARRYQGSGYPIDELINEGNLGLIEAARRFDPDRDVRFVTYAAWWIRQAILAAIAHYGQSFSVPPRLKHQIYRFETEVRNLTQELGRRPSREEISLSLAIPEDEIERLMGRVPRETAPCADLDNFDALDAIADSRVAPQDLDLVRESFERQLEDLLSQLDPRERAVVEARFGLRDEEPRTLADLGRELGLSAERIRQLEVRALGKLGRSRRAQQLRGYLN